MLQCICTIFSGHNKSTLGTSDYFLLPCEHVLRIRLLKTNREDTVVSRGSGIGGMGSLVGSCGLVCVCVCVVWSGFVDAVLL